MWGRIANTAREGARFGTDVWFGRGGAGCDSEGRFPLIEGFVLLIEIGVVLEGLLLGQLVALRLRRRELVLFVGVRHWNSAGKERGGISVPPLFSRGLARSLPR